MYQGAPHRQELTPWGRGRNLLSPPGQVGGSATRGLPRRGREVGRGRSLKMARGFVLPQASGLRSPQVEGGGRDGTRTNRRNVAGGTGVGEYQGIECQRVCLGKAAGHCSQGRVRAAPHRHSCSTRVCVQLRQLTWQHQWKVQLQRSVTRCVRVRWPRPQQSSSQPSSAGDELLHARPAVPAVPRRPLYVQKLGDFSK